MEKQNTRKDEIIATTILWSCLVGAPVISITSCAMEVYERSKASKVGFQYEVIEAKPCEPFIPVHGFDKNNDGIIERIRTYQVCYGARIAFPVINDYYVGDAEFREQYKKTVWR